LSRSEEEIKAKMNETLDVVRAQTTKIDSIDQLMDGMRQQIIDLQAAAGASHEILNIANAFFNEAKGQSDKIDQVIIENVPPVPA